MINADRQIWLDIVLLLLFVCVQVEWPVTWTVSTCTWYPGKHSTHTRITTHQTFTFITGSCQWRPCHCGFARWELSLIYSSYISPMIIWSIPFSHVFCVSRFLCVLGSDCSQAVLHTLWQWGVTIGDLGSHINYGQVLQGHPMTGDTAIP